jgi:hypothetical protein
MKKAPRGAQNPREAIDWRARAGGHKKVRQQVKPPYGGLVPIRQRHALSRSFSLTSWGIDRVRRQRL